VDDYRLWEKQKKIKEVSIMEALQSLSQIPEKHRDNPFTFTEEVSDDGLYVSEAEYWEKYYNHPDFSYEWNNGYLEEKPMTDLKGSLVYQWFCDILRRYFSTYPVGTLINLEIGFRLALPRGKSVRKPDLAVVLNDNPVMMNLSDSSYKGTFDLCIESLSYSRPKEIKRDTVEKKKEYEGIRVKEYYILDARGMETAFYRLNRKGKYQKISPTDNGVICSEVLPGFQFRISDMYDRPPLEQLAEDAVYQDYVLPFYRNIKLRAEYAEQQLIAERRKSENLAAKLRELGIEI
jgi:Uma2 family endonuclease